MLTGVDSTGIRVNVLAVETVIASSTPAFEPTPSAVRAGAPVHTRCITTVLYYSITLCPCITCTTLALGVPCTGHALASIVALTVATPVKGQLTPVPSEALSTVTPPLSCSQRDTRTSVGADVLLTQSLLPTPGPCIACTALALVVGGVVSRCAAATILTRIVVTIARIKSTRLTSEICRTIAEVVILLIHTLCTVKARVVSAVIYIYLTVPACETLLTDAVV